MECHRLRHRHALRAIQGVRAFFLDTPPVTAGVGGADSVGHGMLIDAILRVAKFLQYFSMLWPSLWFAPDSSPLDAERGLLNYSPVAVEVRSKATACSAA